MRLRIAALACAALCASPLAAQDRWEFVAGDETDFTTYVTPPDTIVEGEEVFEFPVGLLEFGGDYSLLGVPEAPNSEPGDAATSGLLTGVNLTGLGTRSDAAGVWTNNVYSGNYRVDVDVYYYWNGGGGSTEDLIFGINHSQTEKPLNLDQDNPDITISGETFVNPSERSGLDGYFLYFFGDIDLANEDVFFMYGVPDEGEGETFVAGQSPISRNRGEPIGQFDRGVFGTGLTWGDGLNENFSARNAEEVIPADPEDPESQPTPVTFFLDSFPYANPVGSITNAWTTLRYEYVDGVVNLYARQWPNADQTGDPTEFQLLLSYDDPADSFTQGSVYLGHADYFAGANEFNRMIYDNLVITPLDSEPPTLPTFSLLGEVDISAFGITPTDIAFNDGDIFVSCFAANRQIVRISDILTTNPQVSTFAVSAGPGSLPAADPAPDGPVDWPDTRGLTSIDVNPLNGNVLAAGDPGSGPLAVIEYDSAGNLIKLMEIPTPEVSFSRINVARYFGDNGVLFGSVFGTVLHANSSLDALVDPFSVGGYPNFTRGIAFSGDDIFIRTTSNGPDKIQRISGGTLGSLTGYDWEGFQFAEIGAQTFNTSSGIQAFTHAGTTNYIVANKTSAPIEIQFYDPATPFENFPTTPEFVLDAADLGTGQLLALGFATTVDGQFMFVGRTGTDAASNSIQVYGIDGAELEIVPVGTLGDINDDGVINVADVTELANLVAANTPPSNEVGDVNGDETVDEADVAALAAQIVD